MTIPPQPMTDQARPDGELVERLLHWIDGIIERADKHGSTEGLWLLADQWRFVRSTIAALSSERIAPQPDTERDRKLPRNAGSQSPTGVDAGTTSYPVAPDTGERAQIVAWLRSQSMTSIGVALTLAATAIEQGQHLSSLTPSKEGE